MILFAGFLAFSINYSKAFRVKDGVIERIRKFNGLNSDTIQDISSFLHEINYTIINKWKQFPVSIYFNLIQKN